MQGHTKPGSSSDAPTFARDHICTGVCKDTYISSHTRTGTYTYFRRQEERRKGGFTIKKQILDKRDLPFLLLVPEGRGPSACPGREGPRVRGKSADISLWEVHVPRGFRRLVSVPPPPSSRKQTFVGIRRVIPLRFWVWARQACAHVGIPAQK